MTGDDRSECPTPLELETHLSEPRADAETAAHVESCARCSRELEDIRANNELMRRIVASDLDRAEVAAPIPGREGAGHAIDGYEIIGEIQRGSQGAVYRARQQATNRIVALKVLLAGAFATSRQRRRFEREIELLAGLEHPNIVTIYDSGVARDGSLFYAMQHVDGIPLDDWMVDRLGSDRPRLDLDMLLKRFTMICDGVDFAHRHGVIHRDLKPANILLDERDRPLIVDFGLAKPVDEADRREMATVTVTGSFLGTLAYASPEQLRGDPSLVDVRSDIYALGVILYELLTGALPFSLDGELAVVLREIAEADPIPPSAQPPSEQRGRHFRYRINDELETIVLKTLAKLPERRYQSVSALRDDIERLRTGAPIEAKRDSHWYVLKKSLVRNRVPVMIAAAFVGLLLVLMAAVLFKNAEIRTEARKLRQVNIFLEDTLGSVQPGQGGREVAVHELLDEAVQWIDIALAEQPEVAASIRTTVGNSYRSLGLLDEAEVQLMTAWETRLRIHGSDHPEVAQSLNALGMLRRAQGDLDEATRLTIESLNLRKFLIGERSYEASLSIGNLAMIELDRGDHAAAERWMRESLSMRRELFGDVHQDVAMCQFTLGVINVARGRLDQAERFHRNALETRRAVLHENHPDLPRSLEALAALLLETGRAGEAVGQLRELLALRRANLPADHWLVGRALGDLGGALVANGQGEEATTSLLEAHSILSSSLGSDDERTVAVGRRIVELHEASGRPDLAEQWRSLLPAPEPG